MSSITLMDIIDTEVSLGYKIFGGNKERTIICISNTCRLLNKITKKENAKHREKYFAIVDLSKKIKKSIKNLTYINLGFRYKSEIYISNVEKNYVDDYMIGFNMDRKEFGLHYQITIDALGEQINNKYYDNILQQMITEFLIWVKFTTIHYYTSQEFICDYHITMMINTYTFIKCGMKYTLTKKDFEGKEYVLSILENLFGNDHRIIE
jgi:hypothetical protein